MSGLSPPNSLSYTGQVAVPSINRTFPPTTAFNDFNVPTIWTDTLHENAYILVSKAMGVADWVMIGGTPGELDTITTPTGVVVPSSGNINFLNGTGMNITGSGNSITFGISVPLTVAQGGTGQTSLTNHSVVLGQGSSAVSFAGPNASTHAIFMSAGAAADPTFTTTGTPYLTGVSFNTGTDVLSAYHTDTFVPSLTFGGGSTGITYTTQDGKFTQIGNLVFASIHIILTSKGSSTGLAAINLPIPGSATPLSSANFSLMSNITLGGGYSNVGGYPQSGFLNLFASGSGLAFTGLLDTNFANDTTLYASWMYFV